MQRVNIAIRSTRLIRNKTRSRAWLVFKDKTPGLHAQMPVYIYACQRRAMRRLDAYSNDTVGF